MTAAIYEKLAAALDRLPNGFPRTPSNVEIQVLRRIFSPDEAALAAQLGHEMEPVDQVAQRAGLPKEEANNRLNAMARRGLLWFEKKNRQLRFRLAPFVVGIYESQLQNLDEELARLIEEYLTDGGAAGIMKPQPALHRVIPVHGATDAEWVLPYDDVRAILEQAERFSVRDCICRVQRAQLGHRCDFPLKICLSFKMAGGEPGADDISREQAIALLDKAEKVGLVHTVRNVIEGLGYVCNCCGCCCTILRGITDWGIEKSVAYANYYAAIDPDECEECGTCRERCQVDAISASDGSSVVDRNRCIGCGLCVTECPSDAAQLVRKPENEIVHPPANFPTWEHERLRNRGIKT